MALHLACIFRVKTLVIVHKSFLMNQWKERIESFVPHAKIGKIQGQIIDTADKDIVLAMLQSVSTKDYPEDTFADIGLVIADEAHHLSAEVFCRALPKVAAKYMMGLSATPKRKDGLTKVFKWYLGEIAYTLDRTETQPVLAKMITFKCGDPEYGLEKTNFRGAPLIPVLVSDLCRIQSRNDLIQDQIRFYIREDRQIMVISDRLAHLEELKNQFDSDVEKMFSESDRPSSGFYTGKQKQKELNVNEHKRVIFATYGLVREGLDILTLNTIIFATPVADVVQAAGRIFRRIHVMPPLIIDIADTFSIFFKWNKTRRSFYSKKDFIICEYIHHDYDDFSEIDESSETMIASRDDNSVFLDDLDGVENIQENDIFMSSFPPNKRNRSNSSHRQSDSTVDFCCSDDEG